MKDGSRNRNDQAGGSGHTLFIVCRRAHIQCRVGRGQPHEQHDSAFLIAEIMKRTQG
jgi:hypothetical protein